MTDAGDNWIEDFVPYRLYRVTNRLNAKLLSKLKSKRLKTKRPNSKPLHFKMV